MSKRKRRLNRTQKNGVSGVSNKASVDAKLTYAAMMLNYAFEYGVDFKNRIITITGELSAPWFDIIDAALNQMEAESKETVTIRIHSPGGDTYEAMAIVGRIQKSKCHIVTEGYGHIMSAATLVLACGKKRRIHKWCSYMYHEASYGVEDRHSAVKHTVKQVEREEHIWAEAMAECSTKPATFWKKQGIGLDAYFTAEQLVQYGAVDEVF